jgi:hypothetical protein
LTPVFFGGAACRCTSRALTTEGTKVHEGTTEIVSGLFSEALFCLLFTKLEESKRFTA